MDSELTRLTNILPEFKECVPPENQVEIVNWSVCETGNISISRSMLPAHSSAVADHIALVSTQPKDTENLSILTSNSPEPLGKLEDIDEAAPPMFKLASTASRDKVSQVPKRESFRLEPQLTVTDESKEALESAGKVKIEDDLQHITKLEFMDDEPLGLATASMSEVLDVQVDLGSNLESKSITTKDYPRRRRRIVIDAVEICPSRWPLPYLAHVKKETQAHREIDFLNFKIKRPKEALQEGLGSVFRRVDALSIKPFLLPAHLDRDLLDFTVCREFTSSLYGGNPQQTFPKLSKDNRARHPYRDFMYINLIYNPYAPQRPGHPGLFYRSLVSELPKELRVFIRIQHRVWLYLGQYELIPAEPLTKEEWAAKSDQTKEKWCTKISRKQWGKSMRARIALRRSLGREPTPQEVAASDGLGVSANDVRRALDSGTEVMKVSVMKCVGYDEVFQQEMRDKCLTWTPPPKVEKGRSGKKKGANQVKRKAASKTAHGDGVKAMGKMEASVDKLAKRMAADEAPKAQMGLESDMESKTASWEITSTMHGIKRKRQDPFTSDTIVTRHNADHPEHPRRVRRMPSRYLLQ